MTIRASCSSCGEQFRFKDGLAGKKVRCSRCQTVFRIPSGPPPVPRAEEVAPLERDDDEPRSVSRSNKRPAKPAPGEVLVEDDGTGPCLICGKHKTDSTLAFFRLVGVRTVVVASIRRWINLRSYCCEKCFRAGRRISNGRLLCLVCCMMLLPGVLWGTAGIMAALGAEKMAVPIAVIGAMVMLPGYIIGPIVTGILTRRWMADYLGPERDEQLRDLAGFRSWGFLKQLVVLRKIPKKEVFEDIA